MSSFRVAIIGGGLAGALLGNGLLKEGVDCVVYEKDVRGSTREGYQIRLGAAALTGFRACLTQTQLNALLKKFGLSGGLISSAPVLYDRDMVCQLDLTKFPAYTKSAPINRVVLRNFLQEPLHEAGVLHYEKKFVKYEVIATKGQPDKIRIEFEDGSSDECDLLVSAEGSISKVNTQIGLNNIVQLHRKWGFLAKGNLPAEKLQTLTPLLQKGPIACNVGGKVLFASAYLPQATDTSSKVQYDENCASLFWGLSVPSAEVPSGGGRALPNKLQFCIDLIKDWDPRYHDILRALDDEDIYVFQARASSPPAKDWRQKAKVAEDTARGHDRVWMIGDSIHPMLPSRGMGGNQSMHDTADVLEAMSILNLSARKDLPFESEMHAAVAKYESAMIPRAFKWVKTSGGLGGSDPPDSMTAKGKIMIFWISSLLNLVSAYAAIRRAFGFVPVDDAPEFL